MIIKSDYQINEEALKDFQNLINEYDIFNSIEVKYNDPQNKQYLTGNVVKKCRFCHKEFPETKFKSTAHAIPEFMGNKSLISKFECDRCNQYFSQFENEFANFMLPFNTLAGTINKGNKIPKYKSGLEIFHDKNNTININNFPNELSSNTKELELSIDIPTYIPDFIYRSLIKIGLTLIPEDKIGNYSETIEWLMNIDCSTIFPASMAFSIFPFSNRIDNIRCIILSRKEANQKQIPKTLLLVSYQNFSFQTIFPLPATENFNTLSPFPMVIPSTLDLNLNIAKDKVYKVVELDKKTKVKGEQTKVIITSLD